MREFFSNDGSGIKIFLPSNQKTYSDLRINEQNNL